MVLIGDGMSDWAVDSLGGKTPLEAAVTPNLDFMARNGAVGMVQVVPLEMYPGSDVSNLSIIGYDPREVYTGRSPLEAASIGVTLLPDDVAVRCNIVTIEGEGADSEMYDFSGGHINTADATELLLALKDAAAEKGVTFYPGVSYRHLMVWPAGHDAMTTTPPHDIHGKKITEYLPTGDGAELFINLMAISREIFPNHPINLRRRAEGKKEANSIWLWGQGKAPRMPTFQEKFGLSGAVVAAVDLIKGIGIYLGLEIIEVPGATGYIDTNFAGKAEYALNALETKDFVLIHVEAPDEAGHNGSAPDKVRSIERIDAEMLGPILERARAGDLCILVMPDHPTPIKIRTHAQEPVPFVYYPAPPAMQGNEAARYTEAEARATGLVVESGTRMLGHLLSTR